MSDGYVLSADIVGAKELKEAFEKAGGIVLGALSEGLNKTAFAIEADAKTLAPHDTGTLRDSLHTEPARPINLDMEAKVGTNLEYAPYQEFGTGIYGQNAT